jgi:ubiquinone/menaquinone biosynthesis C-methylase UbiE
VSGPSLGQRLVRGLFGLWSSSYDYSFLQLVLYRPVHRAVMGAIARLPAPPARILDLGCGTGRLTADLERDDPRATVIGLDATFGMLDAARRAKRARHLVCGDAYALPLRPGSLDLVTSTIAWHWLHDPARALAEVRRALVPGGRLVLGTLTAHFISINWFGMRVPTIGRHRADLEAAGYTLESSRWLGPRVCLLIARAGAAPGS